MHLVLAFPKTINDARSVPRVNVHGVGVHRIDPPRDLVRHIHVVAIFKAHRRNRPRIATLPKTEYRGVITVSGDIHPHHQGGVGIFF